MPSKRARRNRTQLPFVIFKELYTNRCFVDEDVLNENGVGIIKASFESKNHEQVVVHVPIAEYFELPHLIQKIGSYGTI